MKKVINLLKKLAITVPLFLAGFNARAAQLEPLVIRDFSCGLVTSLDPTVIGDGCTPEAWNMDIWTGRLQIRRGSLLSNSTPLTGNQPVRFIHEFPDASGNRWMITASSNSLFKSNNSGATNSVLTSTFGFTSSSNFWAVNAYGKARLIDGTTHWITFDGNSVVQSTADPRGNTAVFMFERVWTGGVTGDGSTLFASRFGDPGDWTDDGLADNDATSLPIRKNDGYSIRALIGFQNSILVFKDRSIDAVTMDNSGLVPIVTAISNSIGCSQPRSIQVRYNDVIFMGPDGFYSYANGQLVKISDNIKPTFDSILQRNSASRSFTETTQTDFQSGTSQGVSPTLSPGNVVLSTGQALDNSSSTFAQGSFNANLTTKAINGSVVLSGAFEDFLDSNFTSNPTWVSIGTAPTVSNQRVSFANDSISVTGSAIYTSSMPIVPGEVLIFDSTAFGDFLINGRIALSTYPLTNGEMTRALNTPGNFANNSNIILLDLGNKDLWILQVGTQAALNFSSVSNQERVALSVGATSVTVRNYGSVGTFGVTNNVASVYNYITLGVSNGSATSALPVEFSNLFIATGNVLDNGAFATYVPTSSTFTSRSVQLNNLGVWYGSATLTGNLNGSTATFSVYGDTETNISITNSATWTSSATVSNGTSNTSTGSFVLSNSSYVVYSVGLLRSATASAFGLVYPAFSYSQVDLRYSTGTYLGQPVTLSNIASFGTFNENHTSNSGSIGFEIYTDTDSSLVPNNPNTWVASQTITNNQVPSMSTAPVARVRPIFSVSSYFQNPIFADYTLNWNQGSSNFPVVSLFFEGDYFVSVATKITSYNDTILVYDRNNKWAPPYTGMFAASMGIYNQQAYYGDAITGNIYRFQVDNLYNDNGSTITAHWKSKEFDFGYPMTDKTMMKYYITAKYASSLLYFQFGVNRGNHIAAWETSSVASPLNLASVSGAFRQRIVPNSVTYNKGITHSFSFDSRNLNQTLDLLSVTLNPRLEVDP